MAGEVLVFILFNPRNTSRSISARIDCDSRKMETSGSQAYSLILVNNYATNTKLSFLFSPEVWFKFGDETL